MEYARLAYIYEDPIALCITGAAAYLHAGDSAALDSLSVVPLDEADIMLLRAAQLGSDDAIRFIRYLDEAGLWHHAIPTNTPTIFSENPPTIDSSEYIPINVNK